MKRYFTIALIVVAASASSGCLRGSGALFRATADLAATAAIIGTLVVLHNHDNHYHYDSCGHHRRWHHDRWVYQYNGRWEYYDHRRGAWFYYSN